MLQHNYFLKHLPNDSIILSELGLLQLSTNGNNITHEILETIQALAQSAKSERFCDVAQQSEF